MAAHGAGGFARSVARIVRRALGYGAFGVAVVAAVAFVWILDRKQDLSVWHHADLDEEFRADGAVDSFADYLALEERLFAQLDERVYGEIADRERTLVNRYHRGSLSDPSRWPRDWNRSYAWPVEGPRAGALLLHGLSDSPYSLRSQAEALRRAGVYVVGLRVPGHGTAPVGLTRTTWEDMAAAVALAANHLRERIGDAPLFLVGYSNGGALAVHHALRALDDPALARPDRLVLFSPEIGVSPAAALAVWQDRIGRVLGLEKLAWNSVGPEIDPFKYQSFAVNAADQAHRLTAEIARAMGAAAAAGTLDRFPPTLAFQSAVDATVSTRAVIEGLLGRLPPRGHELVLFDLNRMADVEDLLARDPRTELTTLLDRDDLPFRLRLVTNAAPERAETVVVTVDPDGAPATTAPLDVAWPDDVFSLSHVALPFPPDDPLYGDGRGEESPGVRLGRLALRGERGVLRIGAGDMLRARANPFHAFAEARMLDYLGLALDPEDDAGPEAGQVGEGKDGRVVEDG